MRSIMKIGRGRREREREEIRKKGKLVVVVSQEEGGSRRKSGLREILRIQAKKAKGKQKKI